MAKATATTSDDRFSVGPEAVGRRLDAVVGERDAVGSRAEAQRLIADSRVLIDGAPARKRALLELGQSITIEVRAAQPTDIQPGDVPFVVRYEDEDLMVVDKPAGVVVHPSKGHLEGTLVNGLVALQAAGGDDPTRPGIVHRIDRDTSGLLVVARNERAHRRLQRMMKAHAVDRRYQVLVHGTPPPALTIDRSIGRDRRHRTRMAVNVEDGREAVTHLRVIEQFARHALCEARLETGRTHQIRVHLEAVGHPVVGDPVYGRREDDLDLTRQFLHSYRLSFAHPITEDVFVDVESPLPDDLAAALVHARGIIRPPARPASMREAARKRRAR
jgi:23S rRNA pseudouridine1911/1915/1917 synthase